MSQAPVRPGTAEPSTWSATHIPHGTPLHHHIDATAPEIRLVFGNHDRVELSMAPVVAGQLIVALKTAVGELNATHGLPPLDPDAA